MTAAACRGIASKVLRDGRVELSGGIPFQFPVLTDGHSTEWVVTGPSTSLDLPQLVDLSEGLVQLSGGGTATAPLVTNIDGASFDIRDNVAFTLTLPTNYDFASTGNSQRRTWQVATDGSLQLPNLQTITGGQNLDSDMTIEAFSGGQIDLSSLIMIADPAAGDLRNRSIDVLANGTGSLIDLSALQTFLDREGYEVTGNGQYSGLAALNGGSLQLSTKPADDIQLTGVRLRLDDSSSLPLDRIQSLRDGRVEVDGGIPFQFPVLTDGHSSEWIVAGPLTSLDLPQLVDLSEGLVQLSGGGTATAPLVTNIDGASFDIRHGVTFTLPLPTAYDFASTGNSQRRQWYVASGGILQLPNVQTITGGQSLDADMSIVAESGGQIDLSSVTLITDPAAGDLRLSGVDVLADGANSLIDFVQLADFVDLNGDQLSSLEAVYRGVVIVKPGNSTSVGNGMVFTNDLGVIDGSLVILPGSIVGGNSNVTGNVTMMGGSFIPSGTVTIDTDYVQQADGLLQLEVFGNLPDEADRLLIAGQAMLDGTLEVILANGFEPNLGDSWELLSFSSRIGEFATVIKPMLVDKNLYVRYTDQAVILHTVPSGDFVDDGIYDVQDLDALFGAITAGTNPMGFDITGDGLVDLDDRDAWLAEAGAVNLPSGNPYLLGDVNLDALVDGQDFIVWNAHKFTSTGLWSQGDLNADGITDGQDFILWNANKFLSSGSVLDRETVLMPQEARELDDTQTAQLDDQTPALAATRVPPIYSRGTDHIDAIFRALP